MTSPAEYYGIPACHYSGDELFALELHALYEKTGGNMGLRLAPEALATMTESARNRQRQAEMNLARQKKGK